MLAKEIREKQMKSFFRKSIRLKMNFLTFVSKEATGQLENTDSFKNCKENNCSY